MIKLPKNMYYWVGEKPPPLPCRYEDDDGTLITSISGASLTAKILIDRVESVERDVDCTNNDDGTFTIDWAIGADPSSFTGEGIMRVDVEVDDGTRVWYMPRFTIPVKERT